ncbi:Protein of unknown function [Arboricoccus pini]|uniref:DUF2501 domain-containing protein n=1 Tax=Arboricoccus pini TaxID=1963835 RepID=A0A212RTV1_9PROT|nr:DUF2501 domain-containing protein [Arboricoccus pini]SNB76096.1 Protein of unknown function [Arboricoccus pini]
MRPNKMARVLGGLMLAAGLIGTSQAAGLSDMVSGLGGNLPDVSSAGSSNTAGVISYCVKNNYLKGQSASSILNKLSGQSSTTDSDEFGRGQSGQIDTGGGKSFSLSGVQDKVKSKMCDLVLDHAKSLL